METNEMRAFIDQVRSVNQSFRNLVNENEHHDSIPYEKDEDIYQNITSVCSEQFGGVFNENAVMFDPSDNNVIVNGQIGGFDNASFSFKLNDSSGNGCYLWFDNLQLNETVLRKLQTIYAVYSNWKNEMLSISDYKPKNYHE